MFKKSLQTIFALCLASASLHAQCPVASAGPDQTVCAGSTVTLNANTIPNSTIASWTKVGGFLAPAGVITNTASPTSTVTGMNNAETLTLVWSFTDGASCISKDTVIIYVQVKPTKANAGAGTDKTICSGGTATLAGLLPTGSTGLWSKLTGTNSATSLVTDVNNRQSTVSGLGLTGSDALRWTVTNSACAITILDTVVVFENTPPTVANAGLPIQTCQGDTVLLVGNTPTLGTPSWTLPTGSGTAFVPASFSSTVNNDSAKVRGGTAGGNISIAYKISLGTGATVLNGCVSVDTLVVSFNPSVANAGPDQKLCSAGAGTITLNAKPVAIGETGSWSFVSQKGSEVITTPSSYSTTVTAITSDTIVLRWTVNGGGCSDTDDMKVIVLGAAPSVAVAGPSINRCLGDTVQLIGSIATSGNPTWTRSPSGGFFDLTPFYIPFIPTNGANDSIKVVLGTAGTYKLYYTIAVGTVSVGSTCTSRDSLTLVVNAKPKAKAGSNQSSCGGASTFTVRGNKPAIGTGIWSKVSGIGSISQSDTVGTITGASGVGVYMWSVNDGTCTAASTMTLTISIPPSTAVISNHALSGCIGDTITLTGSAAITGTPGWTRSTAGGFFDPGTFSIPFVPANGANQTIKVALKTAGSYKLYYSITNNCISKDSLTLTVTAKETATASAPANACLGASSILTSKKPASGSGIWSIQSPGTGTVVSQSDTLAVVSGLSVGVSTLVWTINSGSTCSSNKKVTITTINCPTGIIENNAGDLAISIMPNPASGWFSLTLKDSQTSYAEVSILTLDGRTVLVEQLGSVKDMVKSINISDLANGIYFVKVKKGENVYNTKIIVQ